MNMLQFAGGLVALAVGAEMLIRGATSLARASGISPLVIGLTVVAFGTSAPELAISAKASLSGESSIALGNVVGSNIFNVLFILGVSALVAPLMVSAQLVRWDVPLMIGVSLLAYLMAGNNLVSRMEGSLLLLLLGCYTGFLIWGSRKQRESSVEGLTLLAKEKGSKQLWKDALWILAGLTLLVLGSRWLLASATNFARVLGVDELIIGLTLVAAGTSLPELMTSVVASIRGQRDIAVGNVVGSNLFNIMGVLGTAALLADQGIEVSSSVLAFDMPIMIAVALACLPIFFTRGEISRWEGALLVFYYLAYTSYLFLDQTANLSLPLFRSAMLFFIIPLTAITLGVVSWNAYRLRSTAPQEGE